MLLLAAGAVVLGLGAWWWLRTPAFTLDVNPNRNVLLVTIDTWRGDALGASGGRVATPNLDKLAANGARFDFAHSHAVVTLVSHSSILSGRYPYEHGVRDNTGYRFPATQPTAATLLKAQGFATGAFIGGFPLDHRFGLGVGFDLYDDRLTASPAGGERERRADAVVASALDWIGKQSGKWFAFVHVYDPHAPYQPPADWAAKYRGQSLSGRGGVDRLGPRSAVRSTRHAIASDARRRHRRSRREPGPARRAAAQHLRVRVDAARAAHRV